MLCTNVKQAVLDLNLLVTLAEIALSRCKLWDHQPTLRLQKFSTQVAASLRRQNLLSASKQRKRAFIHKHWNPTDNAVQMQFCQFG